MLKRKRKRRRTEPKTTEKELNEYTSTEAQAREAAAAVAQHQQPLEVIVVGQYYTGLLAVLVGTLSKLGRGWMRIRGLWRRGGAARHYRRADA